MKWGWWRRLVCLVCVVCVVCVVGGSCEENRDEYRFNQNCCTEIIVQIYVIDL